MAELDPKTIPPYTTHTNVDTLDRVWRPLTAILLAIGWIIPMALGEDVPVGYQALAGLGIGGLGVDRGLFKRKNGKNGNTTTPSE